MDQYQVFAPDETSRLGAAPSQAKGKPRSVLFLQGPISSFFDRTSVLVVRSTSSGHRLGARARSPAM